LHCIGNDNEKFEGGCKYLQAIYFLTRIFLYLYIGVKLLFERNIKEVMDHVGVAILGSQGLSFKVTDGKL
jgi:hypothetical protein